MSKNLRIRSRRRRRRILKFTLMAQITALLSAVSAALGLVMVAVVLCTIFVMSYLWAAIQAWKGYPFQQKFADFADWLHARWTKVPIVK